MAHRIIAIIFCCMFIVAAMDCSSPTSTLPPEVSFGGYPAAKRAYDTTIGGVQLILIAYNQDSNALTNRPHDEFLEMEILNAPQYANTAGWKLFSASMNQSYPLPKAIDPILYVYTHGIPDSSSLQIYYLGLDSTTWIWRDDHDTARIFDATGKLVSELGY